jgi:hypothetical protein
MVTSQAPVAHACNPSYSEGKEQEPIKVWSQPEQIVGDTLSQKYLSQKRAGEMAQGVGPWVQAPALQKKKKKKKRWLQNLMNKKIAR